jgi:CHASE2 domain-containing sensor protein
MARLFAEIAPMMSRPDWILLDFWQSLHGTEKPSPQIVIVAIDEKSVARFGPPAWPRSDYVPLIERLADAGARVIALDFTFAALERESANNALLAAAMKKAGNVVFGYEFTDIGSTSPPVIPPSAVMQANALSQFQSLAIPPAPRLIEPEPALAEAAAAVGHVGTIASDDGRIRFVPLFIQHGEKAYPSLALQIARVYAKMPMEEVELTNGVVRMGIWDIPVSDSGELLLGWPAGGEQSFPQYSFLDVVRGEVPDAVFRGKAVLVVGTSWGLDDRDFPFAVEAPGGLIYATFLDNVFRFDFLQAPTWTFFLEWGLFLRSVVSGYGCFPVSLRGSFSSQSPPWRPSSSAPRPSCSRRRESGSRLSTQVWRSSYRWARWRHTGSRRRAKRWPRSLRARNFSRSASRRRGCWTWRSRPSTSCLSPRT